MDNVYLITRVTERSEYPLATYKECCSAWDAVKHLANTILEKDLGHKGHVESHKESRVGGDVIVCVFNNDGLTKDVFKIRKMMVL